MKTALVVTALLAAPFVARGEVILFDDLGLPRLSPVTDQYASLGVIFSAGEGAVPSIADATRPIFPGDPQGLFAWDGTSPSFQKSITATFDSPVGLAGAWIDFGNFDLGLRIDAYSGPDATGSLLGTSSTTSETFLSVQIDGIRSVVFSQVRPILGSTGATYPIDHFTFEVPSPASAAALSGLLLVSRRRR